MSISERLQRSGLRYEWIHAWGLLLGRPLVNFGLIDDPTATHASVTERGLRPYGRLWEEFRAAAPNGPAAEVLEVGSGPGAGLRHLSRREPATHFIGLDRSRVALAAGRRAGLDMRHGRYEALPFVDKSFDAVLAVEALVYADVDQGLREIHRVLRPGGHLLVAQFMGRDARPAETQAETLLSRPGLRLKRFTDLSEAARRSVSAGEPQRRRQVRYLPKGMQAKQAEYLCLEGSRRYDDWMSGRFCYYAAVLQRV